MADMLITVIVATAGLYIFYRLLSKKKIVKSVDNKVVLITGASSGLGEACASAFCKAGSKIILSSRREDELKRVCSQLKSTRPDAEIAVVPMDLSDFASVSSKVQQAIAVYGHIDILVNCAGMSYRGKVASTLLDVHIKLMNVNYFGQIAITREVLSHMLGRGQGHIVAVGSVQSRVAIPFRSAYGASKHALQAYCDSLRAEVASAGIRVTTFNPGYIKTNISMNAVTDTGANYGSTDENIAKGMDPAYVADRMVLAVQREESEVVVAPIDHRFAIQLRTIAPSLYFTIMAKMAKKHSS